MPVVFADLARTCAPTVAVETIAAVVSLESDFFPLAIRINSGLPPGEPPKNKAEAIEAATTLIAQHQNADLGLGGVNAAELGALNLTVADAFDPCLNLKATAALLNRDYRAAINNGATPAKAEKVMLQSYYGHGNALIGKMVGFDSEVRREAMRLSPKLATLTIRPSQTSAASGDIYRPRRSRRQAMPRHRLKSVRRVRRMGRVQCGAEVAPSCLPERPTGANRMIPKVHVRPFAAAFLMTAVFAVAMTEPAFAQATGGIETVLQNIVTMLTGNVAKLLATIAVIVVGIGWMFGYLDLRKTAYVVLGIGIIFGASQLVSTLSGAG